MLFWQSRGVVQINSWEIRLFFIFRNTCLYKITVSFTMVIKRSPGGESAGGGRSTSKSTCVRPAWTLLTGFGDWSSSSMSKVSASVNSDIGNGSLWAKIGDAECVDQCSWKYTRVWSYQLTSDLSDVYFLVMLTWLAMVGSESSFGAYVCLIIRRPAGLLNDKRSCTRGVV